MTDSFIQDITKAESMNTLAVNPTLAPQLYEPNPNQLYAIDVVEHLAQVSRRTILVYCKHGLISPVVDIESDGFYFDANAIFSLRYIEYLRLKYETNLSCIRMILDLKNEVNHLRAALPARSIPTK
jgi:hypothetical protein